MAFVGLGRRTHARIRQAPRGLIGRADVLLEEAASELQQFEGRLRAETDAELRARLGEDAYAAVYARGVRSRSRTRWRLPSAQTELESRLRASVLFFIATLSRE